MADAVKVATEDLYPVGSWAAAHRKGDEVPYATDADKRRVTDNGWADKLVGPSTKAAAAASEEN